MLLQPRKSKYNKAQKGRKLNKISTNVNFLKLNFGNIGLKSLSYSMCTGKQLDTLYKALNKYIKKSGQIKFNIFPHQPYSKKPSENRMGKGKGSNYFWICKIKPGTVICEIQSNTPLKIIKAIQYAKYRLPFKTKIILL